MELKDTVKYMLSDSYEDRFIGEYLQLEIRARKLKEIIDKQATGGLDFKPTCPPYMLEKQYLNMLHYEQTLKARAHKERITLPEVI